MDNITFGSRIRTIQALEAASFKFIETDNVAGFKPVIDSLWPEKLKAAGCRGYRYFIQQIGEKLSEKYPLIADAAAQIKNFSITNPHAKKDELHAFVKPIIEKLGETIDVTI